MDLIQPEYNLCQVAGSTLGHKHTDKAKANMSKAGKRRVYSEEQRIFC
jgi:hypothetical protein